MSQELPNPAKRDLKARGEASYQEWRQSLIDTPEKRALYDAVAFEGDLWLQLVEARQAAGLTQAEVAERLGFSQPQAVARIEKNPTAYTLKSLRRYIQALGEGFALEVKVRQTPQHEQEHVAATSP